MTPHRAYICLGSNLDDPLKQVTSALSELAAIADTELVAHSPWYRSRAIGPAQPDYINGVAALTTALPAHALLDALQAIEQAHHRVHRERWGPRTLDLDLLLYDSEAIASERLTVPHPELEKRNFVLYSLADIAPELVLPNGTPLESLLTRCSRDGLDLW